jgi:hypothetical protein
MRKLLLATVLLAAAMLPAKADIIVNLGADPTSGTGAFANTNPGTGGGGSGLFIDTYNFSLTQALTLTIAFATNTFAGGAPQQITNFQGAVLDASNVIVLGPELGAPCAAIPNCQVFGGSANLGPGLYHLAISGNAGVDAGYGGNLSTFGVPGPIAGAGLPGLIAAGGMLLAFAKRRRQKLVV